MSNKRVTDVRRFIFTDHWVKMSNLDLFRPEIEGGLGLKLPSAYAEALRTSTLLDMTDEALATSLFQNDIYFYMENIK